MTIRPEKWPNQKQDVDLRDQDFYTYPLKWLAQTVDIAIRPYGRLQDTDAQRQYSCNRLYLSAFRLNTTRKANTNKPEAYKWAARPT